MEKEMILKKLNYITNHYKLNYLNIYFTDKGTLLFKDLEDNNKTLRNCRNKLLHNNIAIWWLINEAIVEDTYIHELLEISEVLYMEKENYTFKEFIREFAKYDDENIWEIEEIKALYKELISVYGVVNSENFDIEYCIKNKDLVQF